MVMCSVDPVLVSVLRRKRLLQELLQRSRGRRINKEMSQGKLGDWETSYVDSTGLASRLEWSLRI